MNGIDCTSCRNNLMPGGNSVTFTGDHHLTISGPSTSTLKCGFCGNTQLLSSNQLTLMGMSFG